MMQVRIYKFIDSQWAMRLVSVLLISGLGVGFLAAEWAAYGVWWKVLPLIVLAWTGWCSAWFFLFVLLGRALLWMERRIYPSYNPKKHKLRD